MSEEPEISFPTEEPRYCPSCGTRVAARATTCLMCGASLEEEETATTEEEPQQRLPSWISSVVVVVLASVILAGGGFGLYTMLTSDREPEALTPSVTPSRTPTATSTTTPTQTPTPTITPTPIPPRSHQVEEGETLSDIAEAYNITVEQILALNPDMDPDLIQQGQVLLIPAATPRPGPTSTLEPDAPTPTPSDFVVHVVEPGETLLSIAEEYGIPVSLIRTANDLAPDEETIQANQSLVIPLDTPEPSPTPTENPNATPTPVPPYKAPPLLGPPDGAVFKGQDEPILLHWSSVSVLNDNEWYELRLSQPAGGVVSSTQRIKATAWRVPFDLLSRADANQQEFRWRVQIVREIAGGSGYELAGAPSEVRTFTWLAPTLTPGPSATPSR